MGRSRLCPVTQQIIAEIDFEVTWESRLCMWHQEEECADRSQETQPAQRLKIPGSISLAEREAHSLAHMPFRSWWSMCQRAKGQQHYHKTWSQKASSVIELDHSFYKVEIAPSNLKILTFVGENASMSGAVRAPDVSANFIDVKALKQLIVVVGFAKSVTQCDGHSGLLKEGRGMSLPTQVSPLFHIKVKEQWRGFASLYGESRTIRVGLADHLGFRADQVNRRAGKVSAVNHSACSLRHQ